MKDSVRSVGKSRGKRERENGLSAALNFIIKRGLNLPRLLLQVFFLFLPKTRREKNQE